MASHKKVRKVLFLTLLGGILVSSGVYGAQVGSRRPHSLDVVVRDQKGALVTDLKADEIEILDNGAKQQIESLVFRRDVGQTSSQLVTLVFGGLGAEGRRYARQAAGDFLKEKPENVAVAVFVINRRLYLLRPYSSRSKDLEAAIKLATSGSFEKFIKTSDEFQRDLSNKKSGVQAEEQVVLNVLERAAKTQREEGTYAALDSLTILADALAALPGRNPVIFFSEGLVIRDDMFDRVDFLTSAASLAATPVYTVDARGLLASGLVDGTRSMLDSARGESESGFGFGSTSAGQARALESASQSIRMNAQEALADLSQRTGGFLIANTNDSLPGMKRIVEELDGHYELNYVPSASKGDGTFHQTAINVSRANLRVQTPLGYFDLPRVGGDSILSYELPILSLLGRAELSNDFQLEVRMLRFGFRNERIQHTFAMVVPLKHFTFLPNEEANIYNTHFSLVGLVKDGQGQIVEKFSQDYPLQGPLEKMESMKSGNVLFLRNCMLSPGDYTLEAAALDHGTSETSAIRVPMTVKSWPQGPVLSSLMVIDRVDPISDEAKEIDNPLRYQSQKIAPNLGTPIVKHPDLQVGFYCVVYPDPKVKDPIVMALVFLYEGQPLFKGQPPLPEPDEKGWMQVVLNLPMGNLRAGHYEVIAVLQQGEAVVEERTKFSIVENQ